MINPSSQDIEIAKGTEVALQTKISDDDIWAIQTVQIMFKESVPTKMKQLKKSSENDYV